MSGKHLFKKTVLKPSGHGALSEGKNLTTASISVLEKGIINLERSDELELRLAKCSGIGEKLVVPNLSLKDCQMRVSFSLCDTSSLP